jgi:alkanesulfonate monooxygenase SsuD/methylene tetrahydromethanopterin reductase-like flavin-dependent oxidoreductase (luciferase family)
VDLGIYSFAELGAGVDWRGRLRDLLEEIELADRVGLDVFGVGEHHRPDFAVSAPVVVLAAAAARTARIRPRAPSRCSAPMIRCACSSSSPRSI